MLSVKENFLETIRKGGKPDRIVKQYEATAFLPGDPVCTFIRGNRYPGMPEMKDLWGTTVQWPEGIIAAMPHVTNENKVIKDITHWRDYTTVPDLVANCSDPALWAPYLERVEAARRDGKLAMMFAPTGIFERLHFLMGFEDTFLNMMIEEDAFQDLCNAIGEYRFQGLKLMVDMAHPDIIDCHDDWGSKTNLFMQPDLWREYIKPWYKKAYDYLHDNGVIIMHHADSFCEPIVEDMVDLKIDIWQGILPQNNVQKIQKELDGRMCLMGGLDSAVIDRADSTEEEIRTETRRVLEEYTPAGNFIPCITYGAPGSLYPNADKFINDEIDRYNKEKFGI